MQIFTSLKLASKKAFSPVAPGNNRQAKASGLVFFETLFLVC